MFANKGDSVRKTVESSDAGRVGRSRKAPDFRDMIERDSDQIGTKLFYLLGMSRSDKIGQVGRFKERARRWDWNGHAFLLVTQKDEYVALRIMSTEVADSGARSRVPDAVLMERARKNVVRSPNGDVLITDIPMVNQGPKGYCVPATWERVLRYMGISADMYVLAMVGQTGVGGGTTTTAIAQGAANAVTDSGRKIEHISAKPDVSSLSRYIDRGLPIMWSMSSSAQFNERANRRKSLREAMDDPYRWRVFLADERRRLGPLKFDTGRRHTCMIIGYNKVTDEIAVSDSWGPQAAVRWISTEEAKQVDGGSFTVIGF